MKNIIWSYLIDKAVVNRDGSIIFYFRNGKEIKINRSVYKKVGKKWLNIGLLFDIPL